MGWNFRAYKVPFFVLFRHSFFALFGPVFHVRGSPEVSRAKCEMSYSWFGVELFNLGCLCSNYRRRAFRCRYEVRGLRSNRAVNFLDHLFEIIFAHLDDFKFALGVFH